MAVVGLVLLAACVNLATLLLARTASRQHETAVRLSLGANRSRIIRQLLTESVLLSGVGGVLGLVLAYWGARLLSEFLLAGQFAAAIDVLPDGRVLLFTLIASIGTGVLFGFAPAFRSTRFDVMPELKRQRVRLLGTRIALQKMLVTAQITLSVLLLVAAGLFLRSLENLHNVNVGFDARHLLEIEMDPKLAGYKQDRVREFYREVQDRVSRLPGIISASFGYIEPMKNSYWLSGIRVQGFEPQPGRSWASLGHRRSRLFQDSSNTNSPRARLRTARCAKCSARCNCERELRGILLRSTRPIGKLIGPAEGKGPADYQIIGIAKDVKYASLREATPRFWYIPY